MFIIIIIGLWLPRFGLLIKEPYADGTEQSAIHHRVLQFFNPFNEERHLST
jgi:hypothetical protein